MLDQIISEAIEVWDADVHCQFLKDIIPLIELYEVEEDDDWLDKIVAEEDVTNVRLIQTVYLISKISETHAGILASFKAKFPKLYLKMETLNYAST